MFKVWEYDGVGYVEVYKCDTVGQAIDEAMAIAGKGKRVRLTKKDRFSHTVRLAWHADGALRYDNSRYMFGCGSWKE